MTMRLLADPAPPLPEHDEPCLATCDTCGHLHRCSVGGEPPAAGAPPTAWERVLCLGCLVRAGQGDPAVKRQRTRPEQLRAA